MGHQLCSRTVDPEKTFLSLGFNRAGRSRASLNLCGVFRAQLERPRVGDLLFCSDACALPT
jgi:hypothetical protein